MCYYAELDDARFIGGDPCLPCINQVWDAQNTHDWLKAKSSVIVARQDLACQTRVVTADHRGTPGRGRDRGDSRAQRGERRRGGHDPLRRRVEGASAARDAPRESGRSATEPSAPYPATGGDGGSGGGGGRSSGSLSRQPRQPPAHHKTTERTAKHCATTREFTHGGSVRHAAR